MARKIDVISSCLVGTASKNAGSMSRMELTPWDLRLLQLVPIQKLILFHKPEAREIDENFIDHLKHSLSRTLDFFPPLSGRLAATTTTTENDDTNTTCWFVDCNDAGVEFTHAVAPSVSVSDVLEPAYIPQLVSCFFPLNGVHNWEGVSRPLLGVQVTELADGLLIGCTANHVIVDGTSVWHFFNSWTEISRGCDTISKYPVFERWYPGNENGPLRLPPLLLDQNPSRTFVDPPLLERVFHFSKESIAKLKAKANSEAGTDKISSLQALSAHLWRSYTRSCRHASRSSNHDLSSQKARFAIIIGTRGRIPLPECYFGNACYAAAIAAAEPEILENGLGYAALKINEVVAQKTCSEAIIKFVQDWAKNPILRPKGDFPFTISSSPRFNVYGNDFGWGKPIAVRSGKMANFDGKVTLYPAAVAGGIDLEICLAPEKMQAMERDAEFMEAFTI